jgi:hypothetical protein
MNLQHQHRLLEYYESGYTIIINDSIYLDSPVKSIHLDPENEDMFAYDSSTYADRPLNEISPSRVKVLKDIPDWWTSKE